MKPTIWLLAVTTLASGACDFDISNPNSPPPIGSNPSRAEVAAAAAGILIAARQDAADWALDAGIIGREAYRFDGSDPRFISEFLVGPLDPGSGAFGGGRNHQGHDVFARCVAPKRCVVTHPLNPPELIPLVEVVPSDFSDPAAVARADGYLRALGRIPIVLKRPVPGFVVGRIAAAVWRGYWNVSRTTTCASSTWASIPGRTTAGRSGRSSTTGARSGGRHDHPDERAPGRGRAPGLQGGPRRQRGRLRGARSLRDRGRGIQRGCEREHVGQEFHHLILNFGNQLASRHCPRA